MQLVLSLFPGIGLLDMAFELEGFCVVRGPDCLWGGDVRNFNPPAGRFDGVIGGPPCQAFSRLAHMVRHNGYEPKFGNLIPEFERVVREAKPAWFLMENVPDAPLPAVEGYGVWSTMLNNRQCIDQETGKPAAQNRVRRWSFGYSATRKVLMIDTAALESRSWQAAVTCSVGGRRRSENPDGIGNQKRTYAGGQIMKGRPLADECELQGLPRDFLDGSPFTVSGRKRMIGNGVPLPMGRAIAKAVMEACGAGEGE